MPKQKMPNKKMKSTKNTRKREENIESSDRTVSVSHIENNSDNGISKSKQLANKLLTRKRPAGRVAKKKTEVKICGNGIIMPTLEDLEKMFEDTDEEQDNVTSQGSVSTVPEARPQRSESPPAKRIKESKIFSKSIYSKSAEIAERLKNVDNSSDSDTTIPYEISSNESNQPHRFSPLPSTSKDSETFLKNDKRLNETLEKSNIESKNGSENHFFNNSNISANSEDDIEIIEDTCEIIELDDEGNNRKTTDKKLQVNMDIIEIIQDTIVIDDDSFNESLPIKNKKVLRTPSPINVEDVYRSVDIKSSVDIDNLLTADADCEIINIDDVLAENNTILEKYSNSKQLNTVTHVVPISSSSNIENNVNMPSKVTEEPTQTNQVHTVPQTSVRTSSNVEERSEGRKEATFNNLYNNTLQLLKLFASSRNQIDGHLQQSRNSYLSLDYRMRNNNKYTIRDDHSHQQAIEPSLSIADQSTRIQHLPAIDRQVNVNNYKSPTPVTVNNYQSPTRATPVTTTNNNNLCCSSRDLPTRATPVAVNNYQSPTRAKPFTITSDDYMCDSCTELYTRMISVPDNNYRSPTKATPVTTTSNNYQSSARARPVSSNNNKSPAQTTVKQTVTVPPILTHQQTTPSPEARKGFGDCPICMDPFAGKALVATICGHVFCKSCIESALRSTGRKCPTCRKVLKKNSYHQLYL